MEFIVFITVTFALFLFVYARYLKANSDIHNRISTLDMREAKVDRMVEAVKAGNELLKERLYELNGRIDDADKLVKERQG